MLLIALKMLMGDRAKYTGLLIGISFTAFLVTFAASYFAGFMTRGFSLITENRTVDVWVMDPAVSSVEQTINMPSSALGRVRSVAGVKYAAPLALEMVDARFPDGRFQSFQVIGVDDATLAGAPLLRNGAMPSTVLRAPDAALVDAGGTRGKLQTPRLKADRWPADGAHLHAPTRSLQAGDTLLVNDHRVKIMGRARALPRYPPRPLLYTTYTNAERILPPERSRLTFIQVWAQPGVSVQQLATNIQRQTGLRARTAKAFTADTVRWYLVNSEDVGDMLAMIVLAMTVGFGVTGVMLYMFTYENLKQYAVLRAMGASQRLLLSMIFIQAALCAVLGAGIGLGVCGVVGESVSAVGYPFRMMWFTPLLGMLGVLLVSVMAAAISSRTVLKLQPAVIFAGR